MKALPSLFGKRTIFVSLLVVVIALIVEKHAYADTIYTVGAGLDVVGYDASAGQQVTSFGSVGSWSAGVAYGNGVLYTVGAGANIVGYDASAGQQVTSFGSVGSWGARVAYQPSVVPLPQSIWLLGSGLIGLAGLWRKKSNPL